MEPQASASIASSQKSKMPVASRQGLCEDFAMGKWTLWLLIAGTVLQAPAADRASADRVSVEQLEQILAAATAKGDAEAARELSPLELSERLSSARMEHWRARLPGEKSRQALLALADTSSFLPPPASEVPATAPPDADAQRRMLGLTVHYLAKTLPLLPNLFATRATTRFENRPLPPGNGRDGANPLRAVNQSTVTVFYRNGQEFVDAGAAKDSKPRTPDKGLTTWGEFGPILGTIVIDAAHSRLEWSHWELGAVGPQAVFRYAVPREKSHYDVHFCCVTRAYGMEVNLVTERAGYHGEITLDPDSGTIVRLTVIADLDAGGPVSEAKLLVEYGAQEIGGQAYVCPVHGIALARSPDLKDLSRTLAQIPHAADQPMLEKTSLASAGGPQQSLLNDVTFGQYHLFRSESRVLTEKEAEDASRRAAPQATPTLDSPALAPRETVAEETASASSPAGPPEANLAPPSLAPPAPLIPEISVTSAAGIPEAPALTPGGAANAPATYRINAHLVDVSLVALDKKGRPLTNLNANDLEVYDNGAKVELRAFAQAGPALPASAPPLSAASSLQPEFSNRTAAADHAAGGAPGNNIVLLIDNRLSYDDLSAARAQMIQFLKGLHENEPVSIYILRSAGFAVLRDTSTDHVALADALARWTPSADNVALGQEEEARNRQQMEYVHNTEDLLSVNGHSLSDSQAQTQALDPQLRELGDNPGRDALAGLVLLARHLASVPGHKSLVWIASDNVLADWTKASLNIDKGSRYIEPTALRAQEAMNEAHVSVYPLDASRLEAGGVDASTGTRNVQLNPSATANQFGGCGTPQSGTRAGQATGNGPELSAGSDISTCAKDLNPGRITAQMQQDLHSIQGIYREIADATGGRAFRRASDIVGELNTVAADGRATYLLSFAPPEAADNKYHLISVKLAGRKDVTLRYRSGYFYREEPAALKDRFREAVLRPEDAGEIGVSATLVADGRGQNLKVDIAAADLELAQQDALWTDRIDVYLVERETAGMKAHVSGQSLTLHLQGGSYEKYLRDGIPYHQVLEVSPGIGSLRIIVLDENSGRMGSVTIPAAALSKAS